MVDIGVSIIIPQRNKPELTIACIEALTEHVEPHHDLEIIVADDGSDPGVLSLVQERFGSLISWVQSKDNVGFAKICNLAAASATGRYLVFLNNDTISKTDWLAPMLAAMRRDDSIGAVGAKLLFPNGTIQHAGVIFHNEAHYPIYPIHAFAGQPGALPEANESHYVYGVTGACILIERDFFYALGRFDESYFLSYEDVDLCLKILKAGRKIWYEASAWMYHFESATRHVEHSLSTERDIRNVTLLNQKWLNSGMITLRYSLQPQVGNATSLVYVMEGLEEIPLIHTRVRHVLSSMRVGDQMWILDYGSPAAQELIKHLVLHNEWIRSISCKGLSREQVGDKVDHEIEVLGKTINSRIVRVHRLGSFNERSQSWRDTASGGETHVFF